MILTILPYFVTKEFQQLFLYYSLQLPQTSRDFFSLSFWTRPLSTYPWRPSSTSNCNWRCKGSFYNLTEVMTA